MPTPIDELTAAFNATAERLLDIPDDSILLTDHQLFHAKLRFVLFFRRMVVFVSEIVVVPTFALFSHTLCSKQQLFLWI